MMFIVFALQLLAAPPNLEHLFGTSLSVVTEANRTYLHAQNENDFAVQIEVLVERQGVHTMAKRRHCGALTTRITIPPFAHRIFFVGSAKPQPGTRSVSVMVIPAGMRCAEVPKHYSWSK
jgi:hypothetical protein